MGKEKLIKRLSWYYPLEKIHAFITFPLLTLYFVLKNPIIQSIWFIYGMVLCIIILYQGQKYWQLKLWRLQNKPFSQKKNLNFFNNAQRINQLLILGIPVIFAIQYFIIDWSTVDFNVIFYSSVVNIFAILEYINYYHKQLMVDNTSDLQYIIRNKKLKTASLAKDLKKNRI